VGGWLTNERFLDGIALSGILPAPLVIFGTFIGYVGAGLPGAVAMTFGIFLPAFAFTLVGHDHLERVVHDSRVHPLLEGVTAGVVGLIAATALGLLRIQLTGSFTILTFGLALLVLVRWHARMAIPAVIGAAALAGLLLHFVAQTS
jgi:chromate transporter